MSTGTLETLSRWGAEGLLCARDLEAVHALVEGDRELPGATRDVLFALLREVLVLRAKVGDLDGGACRGCLCTDHTPCEPSCAWVDEGLCDRCTGEVLTPAHANPEELALMREEIADYARAEQASMVDA